MACRSGPISRKWRAKGITWPGRKPGCVRPLNKSTVNRYMAFLRRAYNLGKEKLGLVTGLTFPHLKETNVGRAIPAAILQAILGAEALTTKWPIRGEFFRFKYLSGVRRGQTPPDATRAVPARHRHDDQAPRPDEDRGRT